MGMPEPVNIPGRLADPGIRPVIVVRIQAYALLLLYHRLVAQPLQAMQCVRSLACMRQGGEAGRKGASCVL